MSEPNHGDPEDSAAPPADAIDHDDPHKVEKLAKFGNPSRDPDDGSD